MTGAGPKGRKELIRDIEAKGYQFVDTINKDTNILICEDINSNSTKLQKAVKLGIKLMTYTEFFN
jgi:NAD-dependent DNA ligase